MPKSPEEMAEAMRANLKEKTGKTHAQWMKIAKACKLEKHGQIVKHLKSEYEIGHGFANLIAHDHLGSAAASSDDGDLVAKQYSGKKAGLKPIYDALIKAIGKLGKEVEIAPKKAYVSLRRSKQFALIQPSTATRVDLGINLKGAKAKGRLENSGSFNSMVSHRVRLESAKDVDKEVSGWLKQAYENA
ncbi:MAG: DUF5655 domain-containing protein [Planctomycetota bacterium]